MKNVVSVLGETVQKKYGENIVTSVLGKRGPDNEPTVSVRIDLPNDKSYFGEGSNKHVAKENAAKEALKKEFGCNYEEN
mgnify:FL=1|jgi:dsRNA-specific ribonuclease